MHSVSTPVACPGCGALLPVVPKSAERDPQEILARWSDNHWLDNFGPLLVKKNNPSINPPPTAELAAPPVISPSAAPAPSAPVTSAEDSLDPTMSDDDYFDQEYESGNFVGEEFDPEEIQDLMHDSVGSPKRKGYQLRIDAAHGLAGHHLPEPAIQGQKGTSWLLTAGQMLAYFGVGSLTVGTVMVLVGYYGGNTEWMPTGWLTATAGQMLLFLGVITLVSGGMEQATQEIVQKVDRLGERIIRMERRHNGPPRPNFAKRRTGKESPGATIQKLQRRVIELEQHIRESRRG